MKAADKKAVKTVANAAMSRFAQHVFFLQNSDRKRWDHLWRSVRLRCLECDAGYLRPNVKSVGADATSCVECEAGGLDRGVFWKEKAKIVVHLFADEEVGELVPYIMVEPRPLRVPA